MKPATDLVFHPHYEGASRLRHANKVEDQERRNKKSAQTGLSAGADLLYACKLLKFFPYAQCLRVILNMSSKTTLYKKRMMNSSTLLEPNKPIIKESLCI